MSTCRMIGRRTAFLLVLLAMLQAATAHAARILDPRPIDRLHNAARTKAAALGSFATMTTPQSVFFTVQGTRDWDGAGNDYVVVAVDATFYDANSGAVLRSQSLGRTASVRIPVGTTRSIDLTSLSTVPAPPTGQGVVVVATAYGPASNYQSVSDYTDFLGDSVLSDVATPSGGSLFAQRVSLTVSSTSVSGAGVHISAVATATLSRAPGTGESIALLVSTTTVAGTAAIQQTFSNARPVGGSSYAFNVEFDVPTAYVLAYSTQTHDQRLLVTAELLVGTGGGAPQPCGCTSARAQASVSVATRLACSASASPSSVAVGGVATLTAACRGNFATPLAYRWTDATGAVVGTAATISVAPRTVGTQTYTLAVTDPSAGNVAPAYSISVSINVAGTTGTVTAVGAVAGNLQIGAMGQALGQEFVVTVTDGSGNPVPNVLVSWIPTGTTDTSAAGFGTLSPTSGLTDSRGQARSLLTLGSNPGGRKVQACVNLGPGGNVCFTFEVLSAQDAIAVPAQQVVSPAVVTAITAPTVQMNNVRQRLDQLRVQRRAAATEGLRVSIDGQSLPPLSAFALASTGPDGKPARGGGAAADPPDAFERWGVFINGDLDVGRQSPVDTQGGFKVSSQGITAGVDYRLPGDHVLGAALGALKSGTDLADNAGNQDASGYSVSLFASFVPTENGYVDAIVNFGRNSYDSKRALADSTTATSSTNGEQFGLSLSLGYNFYRGGLTLNPYGRAEYVNARIDGFTENGNPDEVLAIGSQHVSQTTLALGGSVSYAMSTSFGVLIPNARVEYLHIAQNDVGAVTAQLVAIPSSAGAVPLVTQDRNYGLWNVGLQALFGPTASGFINYQASFGRDSFRNQLTTLGFRMEL